MFFLSSWTRSGVWYWAMLLLGVLMFVPSCREAAAPPLSAPPEAIALRDPVLSEPVATAKSFLHALRVEQSALYRNDREVLRAARDQIHEITADTVLLDRIKERAGGKAAARLPSDDALVSKVIIPLERNWGCLLAYYLGGLQPDGAEVVTTATTATVWVPADIEGNEALIRVSLARVDENRWGVVHVQFESDPGRVGASLGEDVATQPAP